MSSVRALRLKVVGLPEDSLSPDEAKALIELVDDLTQSEPETNGHLPEWLTFQEAADAFKYSGYGAVWAVVKKFPEVRTKQEGNILLVNRLDLEAFIKANPKRGGRAA